ncbi:MAG TPA: hypothetical protein VMB27_23975 [Solirubrobacteraceae bacterium]|nr:hypothetical protein [Solirubrobacteraceae bacterium]
MRSRLLTAAVVIAVACAGGGVLAPAALGSANQVSILQDSVQMLNAPAQTMSTARALGVRTVRIIVVWAQVVPSPLSRSAPRGFNASDPNSYPAGLWAPYDKMIEVAHQNGLGVDLTLSGGAPRWAEGPGIPAAALDNPYWAWRPSASAFGQFAHAAGERYSGTYVPPGQTTPLPRVNFWAVWNEPNFGEDLGPQAVNGSTVSVAPGMYRALAGQMWNALQATGHGHDTILVGETAPRGLSGAANRTHPQGLPGEFGQTKPLQFLRTLYCLDSSYRELRGRAASAVGCPTTAAGSRRFRSQNPALFKASGYADHPYPGNAPPNIETSTDPDIATFPRLPTLEHELDRIQRIYGSGKRFPIYNTEYGYITHPPNHDSSVSPATAAYYINWAEYLSWKQPRVASTMQYLLNDPPLTAALMRGDGGFTSGLFFANGKPKPTYAAYRLPLFLPVTAAPRSRSLEVWGCVRPARYAILGAAGLPGTSNGSSQTGANGQPQIARIQFARGTSGSFTTLRTVTISNPNNCYFDVRIRFPASGAVRIAYTYPNNPLLLFAPSIQGATVYSRSVTIKLR